MKKVLYGILILFCFSFVNVKAADMSFSEIGTKMKNAEGSIGSLDSCYTSTVTASDSKITITYTTKDILNGCEDPTGWKLVFEKQGSNIIMKSSMPTSTNRNYNHLLTQDIYWFNKFFSILKYNKKFSELASMDSSTLKNNYNLVLAKSTFKYTPKSNAAANLSNALNAYYEAYNVYSYNAAIKEALKSDSNLSGGLESYKHQCIQYDTSGNETANYIIPFKFEKYTLRLPEYSKYDSNGKLSYATSYGFAIGLKSHDYNGEACSMHNEYIDYTIDYKNSTNANSSGTNPKTYYLSDLASTKSLFNGEIATITSNVYNNAITNLTNTNNYPAESKSLDYLSSFTYTLRTDSSSSSGGNTQTGNTGNTQTGNQSGNTGSSTNTPSDEPTAEKPSIGTPNIGTPNTGSSTNKPSANDNKPHDNGLEKVPSNPKTGYAIPIIILLGGILVATVIILKTKNKNLFRKI